MFVGRIRAKPRARIGRIVAKRVDRDGCKGKAKGEERR